MDKKKKFTYVGIGAIVISLILGLTYYVAHKQKKAEADLFALDIPKPVVKAPLAIAPPTLPVQAKVQQVVPTVAIQEPLKIIDTKVAVEKAPEPIVETKPIADTKPMIETKPIEQPIVHKHIQAKPKPKHKPLLHIESTKQGEKVQATKSDTQPSQSKQKAWYE